MQATLKAKNGTDTKASLTELDGELDWDLRINKAAVYVDPRTRMGMKTVENIEWK